MFQISANWIGGPSAGKRGGDGQYSGPLLFIWLHNTLTTVNFACAAAFFVDLCICFVTLHLPNTVCSADTSLTK